MLCDREGRKRLEPPASTEDTWVQMTLSVPGRAFKTVERVGGWSPSVEESNYVLHSWGAACLSPSQVSLGDPGWARLRKTLWVCCRRPSVVSTGQTTNDIFGELVTSCGEFPQKLPLSKFSYFFKSSISVQKCAATRWVAVSSRLLQILKQSNMDQYLWTLALTRTSPLRWALWLFSTLKFD